MNAHATDARTPRRHSLEAAGLVLAVALAAALLVWGAHQGRAGVRSVDLGWPGGSSLIVWRSPNGIMTARLTQADGATIQRDLGPGTDARLVTGDGTPLLLITDASGGRRLLRFSPTTHRWTTLAASLTPDGLTTAVAGGGLVYFTEGAGKGAVVVAVRTDGRTAARIVARYRLPVLPPDPQALLPGYSGAGAASPLATPRRGKVDDLFVAGGHLLALTSTHDAAAVADLTSGVTTPLTGFTRIAAATMGGDGLLYVLAGRADPTFSLQFLRVDPKPMQVISAWDTGAADLFEPVTALPTRFGAVFYSPGTPHTLGASSDTNVWLVDSSGIHQNSAVSSNTGIRMGPGRSDTVLLYGFPAGGTVSRLGTSDGALSRASARLSAPSDASVLVAAD